MLDQPRAWRRGTHRRHALFKFVIATAWILKREIDRLWQNFSFRKPTKETGLWHMFPGFYNPNTNITDGGSTHSTRLGEAVLAVAHPVLPFVSHLCLEALVHCNI